MGKIANEGNSAKAGTNVAATFTQADAKKLVRKINKVALKTVEKGCMDIGELVLKEVFGGNLDEACSKDPFKSNALVMVCKDPELMVNRRRLGEWVRAAALRKELMAKNVGWFFLSYSHFAALLQVEDANKRVKLAATANKERWSARALAKEIRKGKGAVSLNGDAGNQPQASEINRARTEELMKTAGDFLALMQNEEVRGLLEDPQELKDSLEYDIRIHFARWVEEFVSRLAESTNLLKVANRHIRKIEAEALKVLDDDVMDVEATVV